MILGCSMVILLYLLANVAYVVTLPLDCDPARAEERPGRHGASWRRSSARAARPIMAVAILISTFGCVNGLVLAGRRIYYAMAADGLFFRGVATTNRFHVPAVALVGPGPLGGAAGAAGDGHPIGEPAP